LGGENGFFPRAKKLNPVLLVLSVLQIYERPVLLITEISGIGLGDNPGLEHDPIIVAEGLTKHFRVRLDGDDFRERVRLFFKPEYAPRWDAG
jgi:hypothetical protein